MLTLYEGNKFSGERPGKNERYKKYERGDKYYKVRYVIPWWGNTGEVGVSPIFFAQCVHYEIT